MTQSYQEGGRRPPAYFPIRNGSLYQQTKRTSNAILGHWEAMQSGDRAGSGPPAGGPGPEPTNKAIRFYEPGRSFYKFSTVEIEGCRFLLNNYLKFLFHLLTICLIPNSFSFLIFLFSPLRISWAVMI